MNARTEIERIKDQIHRAYEGDAWHGTNLKDSLAIVDWKTSYRVPYEGGNSIWRLVMHLGTWYEVAVTRLNGEAYDPPRSEDFPDPSRQDEEEWIAALDRLENMHRLFLAKLDELGDKELEVRVAGVGYPGYILLHGIVQHLLYHAGQIALIARIEQEFES